MTVLRRFGLTVLLLGLTVIAAHATAGTVNANQETGPLSLANSPAVSVRAVAPLHRIPQLL
jgi:hypothetical protein